MLSKTEYTQNTIIGKVRHEDNISFITHLSLNESYELSAFFSIANLLNIFFFNNITQRLIPFVLTHFSI